MLSASAANALETKPTMEAQQALESMLKDTETMLIRVGADSAQIDKFLRLERINANNIFGIKHRALASSKNLEERQKAVLGEETYNSYLTAIEIEFERSISRED